MNINKIASGVQNTIPTRKIEDKISASILMRSIEDVLELQKPQTELQKKVLSMADEVWQDMKMPESIKPQIVFRPMFPYEAGGTDLSSCKMYLPNEDVRLAISLAVSKGPKGVIAHELRHTKQLYSIAQLIGADKFEKVAREKRDIILDIGWFDFVIKELGQISPNSKDGKYAQKCLSAYIHYPEIKPFDTPIPRAIKRIQYDHNFLERDARNFEKRYQIFTLKDIIAEKIFGTKK